MNSKAINVQDSAEKTTRSSFKLIDRDRPENFWILSTSPQSKERFYFEYSGSHIREVRALHSR